MTLVRGRFWICATLVAVVGLAAVGSTDAALFGLWKSKQKREAVQPKQYLVVFPFDQGDLSKVPSDFGTYVASDVRSVLSSSDRYNVLLYRSRLSPIARAQIDSSLRPSDVEKPFTSEDRAKTSKLAQLLSTDYYVVGTIDDFQVDTSKKTALITLSAEMIDTRTGKLVKTLVITGHTPENTKAVDEEELRDLAKGDAVTKLCAELLAPKKTSEPAAEAEKVASEAPKPGEPKSAPQKPAK